MHYASKEIPLGSAFISIAIKYNSEVITLNSLTLYLYSTVFEKHMYILLNINFTAVVTVLVTYHHLHTKNTISLLSVIK